MAKPAVSRGVGRVRARWLVVAGAITLALGGAVWWKIAGPARLGAVLARKIEAATGASTTIASATFSAGRLHLNDVRASKEGQWLVALTEVKLELRRGMGLRALRPSADSLEAVRVAGGTVSLAEAGQKPDWRKPLARWRESAGLRVIPLTIRSVEVEGGGERRRRLRVDSLTLAPVAENRLEVTAEITDPESTGAWLKATVEVGEDGSDLDGALETNGSAIGGWLGTGSLGAGSLQGRLSVKCRSLLAAEPRLELSGEAKLRDALPSHPRWPKAMGAVTGTATVGGAAVLADPPRLAVSGSFVGLAESVPAAKAKGYFQSAPRKAILNLVLNEASLPPLLAAVKPGAEKQVTAGRGRVELSARQALPADTGQPASMFDGTCRFGQAAVRLRGKAYDNLSGTATFAGTRQASPPSVSKVEVELAPKPGLFQTLSIRWTPAAEERSRWSLSFRGLRLRGAMQAMDLRAGQYRLAGAATGKASFESRRSGPLEGTLRGSGHVYGVSLEGGKWGAIRKGSGSVTLRGAKATLHNGKALWGQSWLRANGDLRWKPAQSIDLGIRCDDLKHADAQRFAGKTKLPRYERPIMSCDLRMKGPLEALQGEGTVHCVALPVSQRLLGDGLTASFTVQWLPSPADRPKLRVTEQRVRLNLIPGIKHLLKGVPGLG